MLPTSILVQPYVFQPNTTMFILYLSFLPPIFQTILRTRLTNQIPRRLFDSGTTSMSISCDNTLAPPLFLIDLYINRLYRSHNALFPLTRPFSDNSFSSSRSFVLCNRLFGGLWLGTAVFSKLGSVSHIAFFVIFYHPGKFSPMFQIPTSTFI